MSGLSDLRPESRKGVGPVYPSRLRFWVEGAVGLALSLVGSLWLIWFALTLRGDL